MVISSGTSAMGDGVLVLLFLLPKAEVVVGRPVLLVAIRGVVLAVVLPGPSAPEVDIPETKPKLVKETEGKKAGGVDSVPRLSLQGVAGAAAGAVLAAFKRCSNSR